MIQLSPLTAGMDDLFDRFPALRDIWADKNLQRLAEDSTLKAVAAMARDPSRDNGPVFLIVNVDSSSQTAQVVGLTGFFYTDKTPEHVHLRWHGIVPLQREKGFAREALEQVRDLAQATHPQARQLLEMIPCSEDRARIEPFFTALGFKPCGPQETHPWATHAWQPIALELQPTPIFKAEAPTRESEANTAQLSGPVNRSRSGPRAVK